MLKRIVQLAIVLIGGTIGVFLVPEIMKLLGVNEASFLYQPYVTATIGALIFFLLLFWSVGYVVDFIKFTEEKLLRIPVTDMIFGSLGLIIGLVVAYMVTLPLTHFDFFLLNSVVPILISGILGYFGFRIGTLKREELINIVTLKSARKKQPEEVKTVAAVHSKILDTSVIIDGRIADIFQTGFVEGDVIIPRFVLSELQYIADSSDALKRNRGRRGLDILNRIQKELHIKVNIEERDYDDISEVDSKLVRLAKDTNGYLVTNDFNLNKICELENVKVLNINDLANAIKPVVLPGEELEVIIIKDGKENNQGVAYLDDGTMIVVEDAKGMSNKRVDIEITSVLQTSAGRMIFARMKKKQQIKQG
ncbi:MAG: PIN/TRAM domain-containing protein [Bacilli bacterium]